MDPSILDSADELTRNPTWASLQRAHTPQELIHHSQKLFQPFTVLSAVAPGDILLLANGEFTIGYNRSSRLVPQMLNLFQGFDPHKNSKDRAREQNLRGGERCESRASLGATLDFSLQQMNLMEAAFEAWREERAREVGR